MMEKVLQNGPNPASLSLFSFFLHDKYRTNTVNDKSVDGVLGTRIWGGRMVGTDKSTEPWRHPNGNIVYRRWMLRYTCHIKGD